MNNLDYLDIMSYQFEKITSLEPITKKDGGILHYDVHLRYDNKRDLELNNYGIGPFTKFKINKSLKIAGVYAITIDDKLQYIGECIDLAARFNTGYGSISPRNCFKTGQHTNCRINSWLTNHFINKSKATLWFYPTKNHKNLEHQILIAIKPPMNISGVRA